MANVGCQRTYVKPLKCGASETKKAKNNPTSETPTYSAAKGHRKNVCVCVRTIIQKKTVKKCKTPKKDNQLGHSQDVWNKLNFPVDYVPMEQLTAV